MEKQNNRLRPCSVFIGRRSGSADAARWIAIFAEVSSHRTILIRLSIFHNWLFLSETAQADSLCRVLSNYWSFWSRCGTSLFLDRINNTSSALSCVLESTFSVWGDVLYRLHLHSQVTASAHSVFRSFTLWHPGQSFWKILIKMWWEKKKKHPTNASVLGISWATPHLDTNCFPIWLFYLFTFLLQPGTLTWCKPESSVLSLYTIIASWLH